MYTIPSRAQSNYTVSWFANNYPGGDSHSYVQIDIHDLFVWPDGTIYTNSAYDEGHSPATVFKNGTVVGTMSNSQGWGRLGGGGVMTDGTNVFMGMSQGCNCSATTAGSSGYPQAYGQVWYAIRRYSATPTINTPTNYPNNATPGYPQPVINSPNPFTTGPNGGSGWDGSMLVVNQTIPVPGSSPMAYSEIGSLVLGIAEMGPTLYAVDYHTTIANGVSTVTNRILAYNVSSLTTAPTVLAQLPVNGIVTQMVSRTSDSTLWLSVIGDGTIGSTSHIYEVNTATGMVTDMRVPNLVSPAGLAFDTKTGELLVADAGPNVEQILFLNVAAAPAVVTRTFGQAGGMLGSSTPGVAADDSFLGLVGVGMDTSENLTVAFNGSGKYLVLPAVTSPNTTLPQHNSGIPQAVIRTYAPSSSSWSLINQLQSESFVNTASIDPNSEVDVYNSQFHFKYNYAAPPDSPQWSFAGTTLNGNKYPQDPRKSSNGIWVAPMFRRIQGQPFLFITQQLPSEFMIYRFDGGIAVPSGRIHYEADKKIGDTPNQPGTTGGPALNSCQATHGSNPYTWRDINGDGAFQANEYVVPAISCFAKGHTYAWQVDSAGNVWVAPGHSNAAPKATDSNTIFEFPFVGLDNYGNPEYPGWDGTTGYLLPTTPGWVDPAPYPSPHLGCVNSVGWQCSYPALTGSNQYIKTQTPGYNTDLICVTDLCQVQRVHYDPLTDSMILVGFTATDENQGFGQLTGGSTMVRYNNWSNASTRTKAWAIALPYALYDEYEGSMSFSNPSGFDAAGNLIFFAYLYDDVDNTAESSGTVLVINALTGATVTSMKRAPTMEPLGGRIDSVYGINAYQRASGDYVVMEEEDNQGKVVVFDLLYGNSNVSLGTSATTAMVGKAVQFNTAVASVGSAYATPTGTVTIVDTSNGSATVCAGAVDTNGNLACGSATLALGTHILQSRYGGDTTHMPFLSNTVTVLIVSAAASTTTTITSASPSNSSPGTNVIFTATVGATMYAPPTGTVTFNNGVTAIGTSLIVGGQASVQTSALPLGTDSITAHYNGDDSVHTASTSAALNYNVQNVTTLSFATVAPQTFGVTPFNVSATSASPGLVTYSVTSGPATLSNSTLTLTGAGTVTLLASQAATSTYTSGTASLSILVNGKPQTIDFLTIAAVTYGVTPITLGATSTSGLAVSFAVVSGPATLNAGALTITGAGAIVVSASQPGNTNYSPATSVTQSITASQANLTVVVANASRGYGIANSPFTSTFTGVLNGDNITVTYSSTAAIGSAIGPYPIIATLVDPSIRLANYRVNNTAGILTVTAAQLNLTANNTTRSFGAVNPSFTGTMSGAVNGDLLTETFSTTATATSVPNTYPIVPGATGLNAADYAVVTGNGVLTVIKALSNSTLAISAATIGLNQPEMLTVQTTSTAGTPTGTVTFFDGSTALSTVPLVGGGATYSTATLPLGPNLLSVTYNGDGNYASSNSASAVTVAVAPLDFTVGSITTTKTGTSGQLANFSLSFTAAPLYGAFPGPVTFAVSGLPIGSAYSFNPTTLAASSPAAPVVLSVQMPLLARLDPAVISTPDGPLFALLLLPLVGLGMCRKTSLQFRLPLAILLAVVGLTLSGCGSNVAGTPSGSTSVFLTITTTSGAIQHSASVTITQ